MSKINVDTTKLAANLENISNDLSVIDRGIHVIQRKYETVDASWDGEAADSFKIHFINNLKNVQDVYGSLKADNELLVKICKSYYQCEQEVIAKIGTMGW